MADTQTMPNTNPETKDSILKILYQIERATEATYPLTSRFAKLFVEKQENEDARKKKLEECSASKKLCPVLFIATAVIGLLAFVVFNSHLLKLVFFLVLLFAIASLFGGSGYKKELTQIEENIKKLDSEIDTVLTQLVQVKKEHQSALSLRATMCPTECSEPRYMRLYISFLETGRADTLKEAKNLFDEHLHRERLEQNVTAQIEMSRKAYEAAERAYEAAERATDAAHDAQNAAHDAAAKAQQALYNSRF